MIHPLGRRGRGFIGAVSMLVFVTVYALTAMIVTQAPAIQHAPSLVQAPIYAVLGLAWIGPLMPLIKWMERGGPSRHVEAASAAPGGDRQS
jgi:hypothetical protein